MTNLFENVGGWATVIAVLVAICAIGVAFFIYFRQKTIRTIDWFGMELSGLLVKPVNDVAEGLALTWNGVSLQSPFTCTVRIMNTGTEAVTLDQYKKTPTLAFTDAVCYDARVIDRSPDNEVRSATILMTGEPRHTVDLPTATQERGEWYEIKMICDGRRRYPEFQARFLNQTRPPTNGFRSGGKVRVRLAQGVLAFGISSFILGAVLGGGKSPHPTVIGIILLAIGTAMVTAGGLLVITASFRRRNINERNEQQIYPFLAD